MTIESFLGLLGPEVEDPEEGIKMSLLLARFAAELLFRVFSPFLSVYSLSESWLC